MLSSLRGRADTSSSMLRSRPSADMLSSDKRPSCIGERSLMLCSPSSARSILSVMIFSPPWEWWNYIFGRAKRVPYQIVNPSPDYSYVGRLCVGPQLGEAGHSSTGQSGPHTGSGERPPVSRIPALPSDRVTARELCEDPV